MDINTAKQLFEEIVELCYESRNPDLISAIEAMYDELEEATRVPKLVSLAEELQVVINETDVLPEEEDAIQEIQEKIEMLSE